MYRYTAAAAAFAASMLACGNGASTVPAPAPVEYIDTQPPKPDYPLCDEIGMLAPANLWGEGERVLEHGAPVVEHPGTCDGFYDKAVAFARGMDGLYPTILLAVDPAFPQWEIEHEFVSHQMDLMVNHMNNAVGGELLRWEKRADCPDSGCFRFIYEEGRQRAGAYIRRGDAHFGFKNTRGIHGASHELLHLLGFHHGCRYEGELCDDHSEYEYYWSAIDGYRGIGMWLPGLGDKRGEHRRCVNWNGDVELRYFQYDDISTFISGEDAGRLKCLYEDWREQ